MLPFSPSPLLPYGRHNRLRNESHSFHRFGSVLCRISTGLRHENRTHPEHAPGIDACGACRLQSFKSNH